MSNSGDIFSQPEDESDNSETNSEEEEEADIDFNEIMKMLENRDKPNKDFKELISACNEELLKKKEKRFSFYNLRNNNPNDQKNHFFLRIFGEYQRSINFPNETFPLCKDNLHNGRAISLYYKSDSPLHTIYDSLNQHFLGFCFTKDENNNEEYMTIELICAEIGIAEILLNHIENIAKKNGKKYLRIESIDTKKTFDFYIENGFFIDGNNNFKTSYGNNVDFIGAIKAQSAAQSAKNTNNNDIHSITNYDDIINEIKKNETIRIRASIYGLKETYDENQWNLTKENYTDEEKEEIIKSIKKKPIIHFGDGPDDKLYDPHKLISMRIKISQYLMDNNYKGIFKISMIKPLFKVDFNIFDKHGNNISKCENNTIDNDDILLESLHKAVPN
jgi:hypothetical protein